MIQIAVCDDDNMFTKFIENFVLTTNNISCDVFSNGAALLQYLKTEPHAYHIYLLDIEMPDINGIDTALAVRKNDRNAVIIFITDYKEYVYDVFEVLPFRFLKKHMNIMTGYLLSPWLQMPLFFAGYTALTW